MGLLRILLPPTDDPFPSLMVRFAWCLNQMYTSYLFHASRCVPVGLPQIKEKTVKAVNTSYTNLGKGGKLVRRKRRKDK